MTIERPATRIAVLTDAHANLPALRAALSAIRAEGCDAVVHTGDAIAIGPYPAECLDLLLSTPNAYLLAGNHESYYLDGLSGPLPPGMGEGEAEHQRWTHAQLDPSLRPVLAQWPYRLTCEFEGVRVQFLHYAPAQGHAFAPVLQDPTASQLDDLFAGCIEAPLLFYGHQHAPSDLTGRARYVNPGSLGCWDRPVARYCLVDLRRGQYTVAHRAVPYDDAPLRQAFAERAVPDRDLIGRIFFGGRFR